MASIPALAGQVEDAVTGLLFEENMDNASCSLRGNGCVAILFGASVPEAEYIRVVEKLKRHPAIPGVLAGRGKDNYCATK